MDISSILLGSFRSSTLTSIPMQQPNFGADNFRSIFTGLTSNLIISAGMDRSAIHEAITNAHAREGNTQGISNSNSLLVQSALPHSLQSKKIALFNIRDYYPPFCHRELNEKLLYAQDLFLRRVNFDGISDVEIIDTLEEWFIRMFGENFDKAYRLQVRTEDFLGPIRPEGKRDFYHIGSMFRWIRGQIFGPDNERIHAANRERLFGDKNDEEIKNTIMESFPQPLTYHDLAMMHSEMREVGLFQGEFRPFSTPPGKVGHTATFIINDIAVHYGSENWASVLNRPVNWQNVINSQNIWLQLGNRVPSRSYVDLFERLISKYANNSGRGNFDPFLTFIRGL